MQALKKELRLMGMSSGDLAKKLNVTETTVSKWMSGVHPRPVHVRKMIEAGITKKTAAFPFTEVEI